MTFFSAPLRSLIVPRLMVVLLSVLFVLHLFWTYLILKAAKQTVTCGKPDDVRSDNEDERKVDRCCTEERNSPTRSGSALFLTVQEGESDFVARRKLGLTFMNINTDNTAINTDGTTFTSFEPPNHYGSVFENVQLQQRKLLNPRRFRDALRRG